MTVADKSRRAALLALAALALWSALAALALRLRHVPPFLILGVGFLLGGLVGFRGLSTRDLKPNVLLLGVYGLFCYHFCLFMALRLAPPVEANLLNYLWPLLIVVLSPLFLPKSPLSLGHVAGVLLGFSGAALLVAGGHAGFTPDHALGYALAVAAALIWSTYSLLTKKYGGFPTSTVAWFCLISGASSLLIHAAIEPPYAFVLSDAPPLLLIGLGPMGASFYLWDRAMKDGDPRVIGTLSYLTPLFSTVLITVLGEGRLTARAAAAGALIVGGAAVGGLAGQNKV